MGSRALGAVQVLGPLEPLLPVCLLFLSLRGQPADLSSASLPPPGLCLWFLSPRSLLWRGLPIPSLFLGRLSFGLSVHRQTEDEDSNAPASARMLPSRFRKSRDCCLERPSSVDELGIGRHWFPAPQGRPLPTPSPASPSVRRTGHNRAFPATPCLRGSLTLRGLSGGCFHAQCPLLFCQERSSQIFSLTVTAHLGGAV